MFPTCPLVLKWRPCFTCLSARPATLSPRNPSLTLFTSPERLVTGNDNKVGAPRAASPPPSPESDRRMIRSSCAIGEDPPGSGADLDSLKRDANGMESSAECSRGAKEGRPSIHWPQTKGRARKKIRPEARFGIPLRGCAPFSMKAPAMTTVAHRFHSIHKRCDARASVSHVALEARKVRARAPIA